MEHYKTLGLISSAEQAVIKAAYKGLVSIYHPDKNNDKPDDKKIKDINKAYAVLSNPVKKKEYDIEIENNNASISAFSINSPFYIDPLEKEWAVAVDFYPEIKRLYNKLAKISWSLSFVYNVQLIEIKYCKKSKKIY